MSGEVAAQAPAFSPRAILALVIVGIVSLAGLAVLSAYAPDLRGGQDGRAHALSKSAVGYAGAPIFMKAAGAPVVVSRTRPSRPAESTVILTPETGLSAKELQAYPKGRLTLIVLQKWATAPDPIRRGFVRKIGVLPGERGLSALLTSYAKTTVVTYRKGRSRPVLRGVSGPLLEAPPMRLGEIDSLATISGEGWTPLLVDETGRAVLFRSTNTPTIWELS